MEVTISMHKDILQSFVKKMNHFQWLNKVKQLKIFSFVQRANTRKQASSRRSLPCDALAPTVQNRAGARCPDDTSALRTAD